MAHYNIGVDYHKKFSYFVVKDKSGQILRKGQVPNRSDKVRSFLKTFH